jgi:hypothetical protein
MFSINLFDDVEYSKLSGSINTTFYIICGKVCFPDIQWTDFSDNILGMWSSVYLDSIKSNKNDFQLYFMDGPYRIDCLKNKDIIELKCLDMHNHKMPDIKCCCQVNINDFTQIIYNAILKLDAIISNLGLISKVENELHANIKALKNMLM